MLKLERDRDGKGSGGEGRENYGGNVEDKLERWDRIS